MEVFLSRLLFTEKKEAPTLPNLLSTLGLVFLLFSFLRIKAGMPYPGKWAIFPVMGALCFIAAGEKAFFNRLILKNKVAVFLGRISYPLYLWHWVLLVYLKIYWGENPPKGVLAAVLALSLALAFFTAKFIENPLRFGNFRRFKTFVLSLAMVSLALFAFVIFSLLPRESENESFYAEFLAYKKEGVVLKLGNRQSNKKIITFGDSHMHHFTRQLVAQLGETYAIDDMALSSCWASQSGTEAFTDWKEGALARTLKERCENIRNLLKKTKKAEVVLTANYEKMFSHSPKTKEAFYQAVMDKVALFSPPPKLMIFIGDPGEVDYACEMANARRFQFKKRECAPTSPEAHLNFIQWSQELSFPPFVRFVYPFLDLCDENGKCRMQEKDGSMNFRDSHHITKSGGKKTVEKIAQLIRESEVPR